MLMEDRVLKQREALRLRVEEELSLKEISKRLGISKSTASLWLRGKPLDRPQAHAGGGIKKTRGKQSWLSKKRPVSCLTKAQKGKVAEAAALFRMVAWGLEAFTSPFDGDVADWVVRNRAGKLVQVQVKWAAIGTHGLPTVSLHHSVDRRRTGRSSRYKDGEFDFIVGYDYFTDTCYVWSWQDVAHLSHAVSITPEAAEAWEKIG